MPSKTTTNLKFRKICCSLNEKKINIIGGIWGLISGLFYIAGIFTSAFTELGDPVFTIEEKILLFPAYVVGILFNSVLIPLFEFLLTLNLVHPKYLVVVVIFLIPLILSTLLGSVVANIMKRAYDGAITKK